MHLVYISQAFNRAGKSPDYIFRKSSDIDVEKVKQCKYYRSLFQKSVFDLILTRCTRRWVLKSGEAVTSIVSYVESKTDSNIEKLPFTKLQVTIVPILIQEKHELLKEEKKCKRRR